MSRRVLVTGVAGFIGFHVAKALLKAGDHVIGVDSFSPYYDVRLKETRASLLHDSGARIVRGDICTKGLLDDCLAQEKCTHIVHLAAQAGVRYSLEEPESYLHSNVDGFLQLLEACRKHPSIPVVWASSSSVYGANTKVPFSCTDPTDCPTNLYGATKKANEVMAYAYHHLFNIALIGLRFFTVYGPWGRPDMAYFLFTRAIMNDESIELYNGGNMQRDFTYIDDIVAGVIAALSSPKRWALYNLGNNHPESLMALVFAIERATKKKARLCYADMQPGDMITTYADIDSARKELGFEPTISLEEGIFRFVTWYKAFYDAVHG